MTTYFVTRHLGAREWAQQRGITVDNLVDHLDMAHVKDGSEKDKVLEIAV